MFSEHSKTSRDIQKALDKRPDRTILENVHVEIPFKLWAGILIMLLVKCLLIITNAICLQFGYKNTCGYHYIIISSLTYDRPHLHVNSYSVYKMKEGVN